MSQVEPYRLTASEAAAQIRTGALSVEAYAQSLLARIQQRDGAVKAWAYLDPEYVLHQARELDKVPLAQRGPLHGVSVAVKDIIYTKDMPTRHNSPIYAASAVGGPGHDAASVMVLRHAGCLLLGKTTTTEFASTVDGPKTCNPHDPHRTPGGSSSGSGAAVADMQAAIGLGTQTGGSTIRPGSFNGIFALKPTWNAINRDGQKIYSLILDTLGLYARSVADLELLADVFALVDDEQPQQPTAAGAGFSIKGAKFGIMKTMVWADNVEPGTAAAMDKAAQLLRDQGAQVEDVELPDDLAALPDWHRVVLDRDGRTAYLPEYRVGKDVLHPQLVGHVENSQGYTHAAHLRAFDSIAAARPRVDALLAGYAAVVTPSVPGEAPLGIAKTGSAVFNCIWTVRGVFFFHSPFPSGPGAMMCPGCLILSFITIHFEGINHFSQALHIPVLNVPGFQGENGMPVGVSLVTPRYHDRKLLAIGAQVGKMFAEKGGWTSQL